MNKIHRLAFFLALCVANQTLLPIIVTATVMSKELPSGKTQQIVLLGDRHMFLDYELEFNKEKIRTITASEQATVLDWAKKCDALVLAEDLAAIQLGKIKQKILTFIKKKSNCSTFLSELTTHCQEKNIRTVNIETRAHTIVRAYLKTN